jgi:hypothetical protein
MPRSNGTLIMAVIIAVAFFFATPGVIWTFPQENLVKDSTRKNDKMNKMNAAVHAAIFGVLLAFAYGPISAIAGAI